MLQVFFYCIGRIVNKPNGVTHKISKPVSSSCATFVFVAQNKILYLDQLAKRTYDYINKIIFV